jgi:hypothetical protein
VKEKFYCKENQLSDFRLELFILARHFLTLRFHVLSNNDVPR